VAKKRTRTRKTKPEAGQVIMDASGWGLEGAAVDLVRDYLDRPLRWIEGAGALAFNNTTAVLWCRGPSGTRDRYEKIVAAGLPVMAVNNYPRWMTPQFWITGDPPHYFRQWIWESPEVVKFVPRDHAGAPTPQDESSVTCKDRPNVFFYHHRTNARDRLWMDLPYVGWGKSPWTNAPEDAGDGKNVSSMLCGLRMLSHLGFTRILLVGADFDPVGNPDPGYFLSIDAQLVPLREQLEQRGVQVIQTNPFAHCRAFDVLPFGEAITPNTPSTSARVDDASTSACRGFSPRQGSQS
jgi:hypothetical protein